VQKSPDRLLGFCTVDPLGGNKSRELLRNNIEKNGFIGLKLHPSIQSFYPNDKKIYPLYEIMQEYGLPILFHTGSIGIKPFKDKYSNPVHLDDVACDFPGLKIIMGHAGKIWHEEAAMLLRKHEKIFADISGNIGRDNKSRSETLKNFLFLAKSYAGALDRVLFGTDYPLFFQDETIEVLEEARDLLNKADPGFISDDDIKNIKYRNASYLLDLDLN
jgi:predicted TIM-barrel fold metal-dependent hydrolase